MSQQQLYYLTKTTYVPPSPNFADLQTTTHTTNSTVTLNPYASEAPPNIPAYKHPNHIHKLYMILGMPKHLCDNWACRKAIDTIEARFYCPLCDFDLCQTCFKFAT